MTRMNNIQHFKNVIIAAYVVLLIIIILNCVVMLNAGEWDINASINRQQEDGGLLNLASMTVYQYKKEIYQRRKPEVVALGSSRALQFRQWMFRKPFTNFGGIQIDPSDLYTVYDTVFMEHKPKLVLLTIDYWSFISNRDTRNLEIVRPLDRSISTEENPNRVLLPLILLYKKFLTSNQYLDLLFSRVPDQFNSLPLYGIAAITRQHGYSPDGSLNYIGTQMKSLLPQKPRDRFAGKLLQYGDTPNNFPKNMQIDYRDMRLIQRLSNEMQENGIKLLPVIAPLPPLVLEGIHSDEQANQYLNNVIKALQEIVPRTVDLTDMRSHGAGNCEYYDGIHGGEMVYARMVNALTEYLPEIMEQYANTELINQVITEQEGFPVAIQDKVSRAFSDEIMTIRNETLCRE